MGKLLQRLSDAAKSGVYRAPREQDVVDALRGSELVLARVDVAGAPGKQAVLERVAKALALPGWFGGNWDALEECLGDLADSGAPGCVLLLAGAHGLPAAVRDSLAEVCAATAEVWKSRKRPFFAVFVDPAAPLPELYKPRV